MLEHEIVSEMSKVQVPSDLIQKDDVVDIMENFKQKIQKLDEFKKIKSDCENKELTRKILDFLFGDNKMKDAQHNAIELQAEFSKLLGKLMLIGVIQSRLLNQQQEKLSVQQDEIKEQTEKIEEQTGMLAEQHKILSKQAFELEKLVKDFLELKEHQNNVAKQIIGIANEVKATQDNLYRKLEYALTESSMQLNQSLEQVFQRASFLQEYVDKTISEASNQLAEVSAELRKSNAKWSVELSDFKMAVSSVEEKLESKGKQIKDLSAQTADNNDALLDMSARVEALTIEFSKYREIMQLKIRGLYMGLGVIGVGIAIYIFIF
jgi:chromosome segregation ATPase